MTDKFSVTPLQQGRFYAIEAFGQPALSLTRLEATELRDSLTHALARDHEGEKP